MGKWWVAPEGVEVEWGNKLKSGVRGGVSLNEEANNYTEVNRMVSGYSGRDVPRFNISPFKLSAGVTLNPVMEYVPDTPLNLSESVKKMNRMIRRSTSINNK